MSSGSLEIEQPAKFAVDAFHRFGIMHGYRDRSGAGSGECLGLLPDIGVEVRAAVEAMRQQQSFLKAEVPPSGNPARRMAGQMMGRWVAMGT